MARRGCAPVAPRARVGDGSEQGDFRLPGKLPRREQIEQRLTALWDYEKHGTPFRAGGRYVMSKNDGLQNHSVIYVAETLEGPRRVLFNPNEWSEDGTVSLGGLSFSHDGALVAYAVQDAGSDWRTWKVKNVVTGQDLGDSLSYLKFTDVVWDPAARGFFYAKYPDPDPDSEFQSLQYRDEGDVSPAGKGTGRGRGGLLPSRPSGVGL